MPRPRVLVVSSHVAQGAVGLKATAPPLFHAGCDVIQVPTVVLSNHLGHRHVAGAAVEAETIARMIDALAANGALDGLSAIITGYLPESAHVSAAAQAITKLTRTPAPPLVVCDPVLGDDPNGLYIPEATALAIKHELLPLADVITPNRFELAWLTARPVQSIGDALTAARDLGIAIVAATSIPAEKQAISTLAVSASVSNSVDVPWRENVPHGTGDLFTGLFTAALVTGQPIDKALQSSTDTLERVIASSCGAPDLDLGEFFAAPPPGSVMP